MQLLLSALKLQIEVDFTPLNSPAMLVDGIYLFISGFAYWTVRQQHHL